MSESPAPQKNSAGAIVAWTVVLSIGYAVLRYHLAGPVPWKDFPFFILNKGISLAAFVLLSFNFAFGPFKNLGVPIPSGWLDARKAIGMTGFLLVLIHVLMSFLLFRPAVYKAFFETNGTLTFNAGVSMLGGVLGFVFLWAYNLSFQTHLREDQKFIGLITSRGVLLAALVLGGVHLFFMGYQGWMKPSHWHGGLPPISLVSFAFFVVGYGANLFGRR